MTDATAGRNRLETAAQDTPFDMGSVPGEQRSLWGDVWVQFKAHRGAMIGLIVLSVILLGVIIGPFIHDIDPSYKDLKNRNAGMSWAHPLGTTRYGEDNLARLLAGGRISLAVGFAAMLLSVVVGTLIGMIAGFFRWLDRLLMGLTDLFLAMPIVPLLLVITMVYKQPVENFFIDLGAWWNGEALAWTRDTTGLTLEGWVLSREDLKLVAIFLLVVVVIGITSWMQTARIVRGDVLAIKEREFVLAARSVGTPSRRILTRHIFPNVLSPIMVSATIGMANAIITESALSFLGLGFPSDFPTWGRLIEENKNFLAESPGQAVWPGVLISLTVLSVNFIGDGLRDALDPRIRGR